MQNTDKTLIFCIGDSWSVLGEPILRKEVHKHISTVDVVGYGISGSTANQWVNQTTRIKQVLNQYPSTQKKLVWLSVGGNDIVQKFMSGYTLETGMKAIQEDMEPILDAILSVDDTTRVFHFGYDFINMEPMLLSLVGKTMRDANTVIVEFSNLLTRLSQSDKYRGRFTHIPMYGLLQTMAGIQGAPNLDRPSPAQYMIDPIHPNGKGFEFFMEKMYREYLANELGVPSTTTQHVPPQQQQWDNRMEGLLDSVLYPQHGTPTTAISENVQSGLYEDELQLLDSMGFTDRVKNSRLLHVYKGDVDRVVASLLEG
jgi:lysophospholipase L1-like esterase